MKENIIHYKRIDKVLGISGKILKEKGVFNGYLDDDSNYYINPYLLKECGIPELNQSEEELEQMFDDIILLLKQHISREKESDESYFTAAVNMFKFKEPKCLALGNSVQGIQGNGLNGKTAEECILKIMSLVKLGRVSFNIIYSLGIFQKNVGSDRVSDMVGDILLPRLMKYSERMYKELNVKGLEEFILNRKGRKYKFLTRFRSDGKTPLVLLPRDILDPLPTTADLSDLDYAIKQNEDCKDYLTNLLSESYKKSKLKDIHKEELFSVAKEYGLFGDVIEKYKEKISNRYSLSESDFDIEEYNLEKEIELGIKNEFNLNNILEARTSYEAALLLLKHFKYQLEETIGIKLLHGRNVVPKEKDFQRAFLFSVEIIRDALPCVLNYEVGKNTGTIDFMLQRSCKDEVYIEFKLSNNDLLHGHDEQLKKYIDSKNKKAKGIFVILKIDDRNLDEFYQKRNKDLGYKIIEIDCRDRESPSKKGK